MKQLETIPCPECDKYIPATATRCRCGWVAKKAQGGYVECAFAGCPHNALVRVKTRTGWANVCVDHDKKIVKERADAYCKSLGLDTVEKQRAWLKKNKPMVKRAPVMREPGEDETYRHEVAECPL